MMRALRLAPLLLSLAGCGAATTQSTLEPLFADPAVAEARRRAPDIYAEAERAREAARRAEGANDVQAAADYATQARLLLTAATVEADRLALEEERLGLERQAREDVRRAIADNAARGELDRRMSRERAADLALQQAEVAFEQAAEDEPRRRRRDENEVRGMHRRAASVLLRRASLALSAAEAMGASAAEVGTLRARIEEARGREDPSAALGEADRIYAEVQAVLGRLRARADAPRADVARSLMSEARVAGFAVHADARGVVLSDDTLFRGGALHPDRRRLERLHTLLVAFPHGQVRIEVFGPTEEARRLEVRARTLAAALARQGIPAERLLHEGVGPDARDVDLHRVDIVFLAYSP